MFTKIIILFLLLFSFSFSNEKVSLQLQWKHQFEFAGFYMAKEKGFYDDVGLDVEFKEYNVGIDVTKDVLNSKTTYGIAYSDIISNYLNGKEVVYLANILKQSPLAIATSIDIKSPKDLIGKKIMGLDISINNTPLLIMLKNSGVNLNDIDLIEPSFDINDFISGKVDATVLYTTNEVFYLEKEDFKYNLLKPSTAGTEFYDLNLFTSKKEARNNPIRTRDFKDASIKGWEYAIENIEETIEVIYEKYNTQNKTKQHLYYEAIEVRNSMMPNIFDIGSIQKHRIRAIAAKFKEFDLVENVEINFNDFIFDFNDYTSRLKLVLTKEEKEYLNNKRVLKVHNENYWPPYNFNSDNKALGFSIDYMEIISSILGIKIEFISGYTWEEYLKMIKTNKLDIMLNTTKTKDREKEYLFTLPYSNAILSIFSRKNQNYYNLEKLKGKTVSVVKGFYEEEFLRKNHPEINLLATKNSLEAFKSVSFGTADATLNILAVGNYIKKEYGLNNIEPAFEVKNKNRDNKLFMITNKDDVLLNSILIKAQKLVTQEQMNRLKVKWLTPKDRDEVNVFKFINGLDSQLIINIVVFLSVFFLLFLFRQYTLWKINKKLELRVKEELIKSRNKDKLIFQQSKLVSMGEMIANISHQWRQPLSILNGIIANLDWDYHNNKLTNDEFKKYMNEMEKTSNYMAKTIRDFSTFFSPTKSKEIFNLSELLVDARDLLRSSLKEKGIKLTINQNKDLSLNSFKSELLQVLIILLNNSKDAYDNHSQLKDKLIVISVSQSDSEVFLEVKDNAGGIEEEILNKIFEPYFTTKHNSKGIGLGLYIVNMIVRNSLKGNIQVKNTHNGVSFMLSIPK